MTASDEQQDLDSVEQPSPVRDPGVTEARPHKTIIRVFDVTDKESSNNEGWDGRDRRACL